MRSVVVGIDGSSAGMAALDLAAEEAAAHVAPLTIVYAHRADSPRVASEGALLDCAVSRVMADHPWLSVSARLAVGDPCQVLMDYSEQALLMVMGYRCRGVLAGRRTSSLAVRTADGSHCPVIVHRPVDTVHRPVDIGRRYEGTRPVLVGVDGGQDSAAVVEFAFDEAALRGAPVLALHVLPKAGSSAAAAAPAPGDANGSHRSDGAGGTDRAGAVTRGGSPDFRRAADVVSQALDTWSAAYPQVPTVRRVARGADVAAALAAASVGAQLAVVGAGDHHDPDRWDVRWMARSMVDRAGCPVAVVHGH